MQSNSRSQPTARVGNLSLRRRPVIPDVTGSSQRIPRVGNLSCRRPDIVSDTVGSSQPTLRVGNLSRRGHKVVRGKQGNRVWYAAGRIRQLPQGATEQSVIKSEFIPTTNWRCLWKTIKAPAEEHNSDDREYRT